MTPELLALAAPAIEALQGERWPIESAGKYLRPAAGLVVSYGDSAAIEDLGLEDPDTPEVPVWIGRTLSSFITRDLNDQFRLLPGKQAHTDKSAMRRSLAALLREHLSLKAVPRNKRHPGYWDRYALADGGDRRLDEWMNERLSLVFWTSPYEQRAMLAKIETAVIRHFQPALNIAKNLRDNTTLVEARAAMAREAAAWAAAQAASLPQRISG